MVSTVIGNKHMRDSLISKGCVPNKSLILKFPSEEILPKELQRHFIRGYFDGDGTIGLYPHSKTNPKLEESLLIVGTKPFLEKVQDVLSIGNQTGEGWFLTAEMIEYMEHGITNIVCVQPFACLPNHVVGKGVIKTIRNKYPEANISPIDYDPGASEANQTNRIKLLMTIAKDNLENKNNLPSRLIYIPT